MYYGFLKKSMAQENKKRRTAKRFQAARPFAFKRYVFRESTDPGDGGCSRNKSGHPTEKAESNAFGLYYSTARHSVNAIRGMPIAHEDIDIAKLSCYIVANPNTAWKGRGLCGT